MICASFNPDDLASMIGDMKGGLLSAFSDPCLAIADMGQNATDICSSIDTTLEDAILAIEYTVNVINGGVDGIIGTVGGISGVVNSVKSTVDAIRTGLGLSGSSSGDNSDLDCTFLSADWIAGKC